MVGKKERREATSFFYCGQGREREKGKWLGWLDRSNFHRRLDVVCRRRLPHSCPGGPHASQPNRGRNSPLSSRGARPTFFRSLYSSSDPKFSPLRRDGLGEPSKLCRRLRRRTFSEQTGVGGGNFFRRYPNRASVWPEEEDRVCPRLLLYSFLPLDILSILTLGPSPPTSVPGRKEQKYDQKSTKGKKFFFVCRARCPVTKLSKFCIHATSTRLSP